MTADEILVAALEKRTPAERAAYLDGACGSDAELRAVVEGLLRSHEEAGSFLEQPLFESTPTIDSPIPAEGPGTMIGSYKLLQEIGEGGMGTVWMAQQTEPVKRLVALKLIKAGMDSKQVIARFEAERQALALMDHPNIARVLDGGSTSTGRPYFVMDLVKGVPITKYSDEHHLTPRQRLELFIPVCQAVQHAHQKGIIHRDLKPSNVLVALYDGKPVPKVIDFGVAKAAGQQLTDKTLVTGFGAIVGTLEYMSPEQAEINQLDIDTRSDIYSLGVLLYELLTGSTPFTKKDLEKAGMLEMLRVIREQEPSKPSTKLSSSDALPTLSANRGTEPTKLTKLVRGELDWIVMKALEKDRNRRYETANGFAQDVQRYLADEAVQACPPSAGYRFRKFVRRNKGPLATIALIAAAVFAIAGTIGWALRDREANAQQVTRDRAAREFAIREEVNAALAEANRWQEQEKWPEALSAAKRAEGLLAGGGDEDLRERVRLVRNDLEMVLRLEEIRLLWSEIRENHFDWATADLAYTQAFANYGIDVLKLSPDEAAARIRARVGVTLPLTVAIDDWAHVRPHQNNPSSAATLTAVAQAADSDPWRRRVREAIRRKDGNALTTLATSPELASQPPVSVLLLGKGLWISDCKQAHVEMLRRAQRRHPGDFWINHTLGWSLEELDAAHLDEAITFSRVALAIRPKSISAHNQLGLHLRKRGKLDEAVASFRRAVELDQTYAKGYANLGNTLQKQGKLDEAVTWLRQAVACQPPRVAGYLGDLGLALQEQPGKLDEAIACHQKAIALEPKVARHYYNLGTALDSTNPDGAIAAYRAAIEVDDSYVYAHHNLGCCLRMQGKLSEAMVCFEKGISLQPKRADSYEGRASVFRDLKQYNKAIIDFSKALELNPDYLPALVNRGLLQIKLKHYDKALADLSRVVELDPDDPAAWSNRGRVNRDLKQFEKALTDFSKAIELKPENFLWWYNRGLVYREMKQYDKALADFSKAIDLKPDHVEVWAYRHGVYQTLKQLDTAIGEYTKTIDRNPKLALGWCYRGQAHASLKQYDKALTDLTKATELTPASQQAWAGRHSVYQTLKRYDKAIADYSELLKLKPDTALAWHYRGQAHASLEQYDKAVADFSEAIKLDPKNFYPVMGRAGAYQKLNQWDKVVADRTLAMELAPDWIHIKHNLARVLANCPDPKYRNPERAVELAKELVGKAPKEFRTFWNTLGVAYYRAGDPMGALTALRMSMELNKGGDAFDWFFVAMAYWKLDDKVDACKWYDQAVAWMDKNQPQNEELRRFRAETRELLGAEKKKD